MTLEDESWLPEPALPVPELESNPRPGGARRAVTLGDRIGRRRLLLIGAAAFGVASVLAAFSVSAEMLIATRALLGLAGATIAPSTLSLIRNIFHDPKERTAAIGVWITSYSVGAATGPLVGGVLLQHFWWGRSRAVSQRDGRCRPARSSARGGGGRTGHARRCPGGGRAAARSAGGCAPRHGSRGVHPGAPADRHRERRHGDGDGRPGRGRAATRSTRG